MNKRNLQNEKLDRIGRKLLDAAKARSEEIEQIVASPALFESIKARIENGQKEQNLKSVSGGWSNFQIWSRQRVAASVSVLIIAGLISFVGINKIVRQQSTEQAAAPKIQSNVEQVEISQYPETVLPGESPAIVKITNPVNESPKNFRQKVFTDKTLKAQKSSIRKPKPQGRFQPEQKESVGEFYALTFAGNPVEAGQEVHIVRTELSRSSLFALGVNLPIENETPKIKTDLLVGADGIARAIRFVANSKSQ